MYSGYAYVATSLIVLSTTIFGIMIGLTIITAATTETTIPGLSI